MLSYDLQGNQKKENRTEMCGLLLSPIYIPRGLDVRTFPANTYSHLREIFTFTLDAVWRRGVACDTLPKIVKCRVQCKIYSLCLFALAAFGMQWYQQDD